MSPSPVSHAKKHTIDSLIDHRPVTGDHDENSVVVMDSQGLPVKDSGIQLSTLVSGLSPIGPWDASGGLYPSNPAPTIGDFWWISVAGTLGGVDYKVNDWLVLVASATWKKIDNTDNETFADFATVMWTSNNGSDTTGNGSYLLPYLTVQKCYDIATTGTSFVIFHLASATQSLSLTDATKVCFIHGFGNCGKVNITTPANVSSTLNVDGILITNITNSNASTLTLSMYSRSKLSLTLQTFIQTGTGTTFAYFFNNVSDDNSLFLLKANVLNAVRGHFIAENNAHISYFTNGLDCADTGRISNLLSPSAADDAATKGYVDGKIVFKADVTLAGATPVDADVTTWTANDRGLGIGTGGREFLMIKRGTAVKSVELV
jgi:hypothetical protein